MAIYRMALRLLVLAMLPMLSACLAKTAVDVVTLPVRAASGAVDLATTSQSEADEKRGRELREREERLGKLERDYAKHSRQCDAGDATACRKARQDYAEIEELLSAPRPQRY